MDDIFDMMHGIDKKNEIFNIWYEVTFLRMIISHMVAQSLYLQKVMTPEVINDCRKHAQKIVQEKFPLIKIDFSTNEGQTEDPACNPHTPLKGPYDSLDPLTGP